MTHFFVFETVLSEKAKQIPSGCQFESHKKKKIKYLLGPDRTPIGVKYKNK